MIRAIAAILEGIRQTRNRKRVVQQFMGQGFRELPCPRVLEMLPLRDAGIVREGSGCLFEKGDTQILVFSTTWTPRSRTPGRGQTFTLVCISLGNDPELGRISGAVREPGELYSIVDQLELDSYPSLSPLPECTIFAADADSAKKILMIAHDHKPRTPAGSLVVHKGRLLLQITEASGPR